MNRSVHGRPVSPGSVPRLAIIFNHLRAPPQRLAPLGLMVAGLHYKAP